MDSQETGWRQRMKANRFASTLVILATLSLGILIGTVVSAGVKGKEKDFDQRRRAADRPLAAATVVAVLADLAPA